MQEPTVPSIVLFPSWMKVWRRLACAALLAGAAASAPAAPPAAQAAPAGPQRLAAQVDRVSWGVTPAELARAQRLSWTVYLQEQLRPRPAALPPAVQARIDALSITRVPARDALLAQRARTAKIRQIEDPARKLAASRENRMVSRQRANETMQRAVWLALYSPNQLQEQMTWFWMNHFSVYAGKANVGTVLDAYEDQAIRPHALGKFRDLLAATARSPAMLIYLDNIRNSAGHINENYARELLELHTLGVQGGYSQRDVQELARVLTGVGLNQTGEAPRVKPAQREQLVEDGLFLFDPGRHDHGDKTVLGHTIRGGRGLAELDEALDLLARHPATARHVSRKLAQYFVADQPPDALVQRMARAFQGSDGDIAATLAAMFESPEFEASLAHGKFKDPAHYLYSALRLAYDGREPLRNPDAALDWLKRMGQPLYQRLTPDGYPMNESDWAGSGQMTTRFEAARAIAAAPATFYRADRDDRPRVPPLPPLVQAYGAGAGPFSALSPATRRAIESAPNVRDANTYLLASPEFMRR